jgi:dTDP-L-rhamnose 4-epimerase
MSGVVLVTGGAGFIGSHLVDVLVEAGRQVRVLDVLLPCAHDRPPGYLSDHAEYVWEDVRDVDAVERALEGVTAVAHQAAMVGLEARFDDVADYVAHNDQGTAALLLALHRRGFGGRLVLGSSMVVYGEGAYRCPRHGPVRPEPRERARLEAGRFEPPCPRCGRNLVPDTVDEGAPVDPRNVYAATKLHQEHLCAVYAREHGVPLVVLRYHNVYGPRMPRDTPYAGVAAIFRSALEAGRSPRVFEDGGQLRDFVHVRDVARAGALSLDPDAPSGTFNVGSGEPHTVGDLAAAMASTFAEGAPAPVVTGEYRLGDVRHVVASTERARARLAFRATVPFEEGVRELARAPLRERAGLGTPLPGGAGSTPRRGGRRVARRAVALARRSRRGG